VHVKYVYGDLLVVTVNTMQRGIQMHTPHAWSSLTHSSVGGLMDPAFLRQAIGDADVSPWTDISSLAPTTSRWGTAIGFIAAGLSTWMSALHSQHRTGLG
jgi:hypothetical protein